MKGAKEKNMTVTGEGRVGPQEILRRKGIKLTHQRLEILRTLMESGDHPSAEEVYKRVKPRLPTVSLDTVYRSLDMFEKIGAISRVEILDDRGRFETRKGTHHHLVCVSCKVIEDFPWPAVDRLKPPPPAARWGRILSGRLELRGVCRDCLKRGGDKE